MSASFFDRPEVDMNDVLRERFSAGLGVVQILQDMTDEMLLLTIKNAVNLSGGKPFTVIPPVQS